MNQAFNLTLGFLLVFVGVATVHAQYAQTVLDQGPIAYWRFTETTGTNAVDSITSPAQDGTLIGGANPNTAGPLPPGFIGFVPANSATAFDGNDDAVNTPVSLSGATSFTLSGWIFSDGSAPQNNRTGLFGQNDAVEFGYINDSTIQLWTPVSGANDVTPPSDDAWHHIAAVGTGTQTEVYIDGVLAGTDPHGALPGTGYGSNGNTVNIGGDGIFDGSGNFFQGNIDEVAVFNRALSAAEIQAQFDSAFTQAIVPEPTSIAIWSLVGLVLAGFGYYRIRRKK